MLLSECAVGRLTRVFARRTRRFVKPRDCMRYWVKFPTDDILKYFSHSSKKTEFSFHANYLHCLNVKPCFLGKKKKKNNNFLSSAELAQIVVVRYPRAPSVVSLSKTLCPHNLVLVSNQEDSA